MFDARPDGKKGFTPTDVIPIVNKSFPDSYGNVEFARKAIRKRGWYPATFALLEDPAIKKTKDADPIDSNITTTSSVSEQDAASCRQVPVVNLEVGIAGKLTDKLLNDQLRKTGRIEKLRRDRDEVNNQDSLAKKLRHSTRMTSGSLASVGQYSLSAEVLQEVEAKAVAAAEKETELTNNRFATAAALQKKTEKAEEVLRAGTTLTVDNLKVLIQSRKRKGDSPMKAVREDLESQWKRRLLRAQNEGPI
jgi:hypothetical protein